MQGKKRFVKLGQEEEILVADGFKNGKKATFRKRCHYILLSHQGKTIKEIADIYKVTRQSITMWFNRYESEGLLGLHTGKGKGRPAIIRLDNEAIVTRIEELVDANAQNLKPVLQKIEEEFGKRMSKRTLQRFLKKKDGVGSDVVR